MNPNLQFPEKLITNVIKVWVTGIFLGMIATFR